MISIENAGQRRAPSDVETCLALKDTLTPSPSHVSIMRRTVVAACSRILRSPISSLTLIFAGVGMALVHPAGALLGLVGLAWLRHQNKLLPRHATAADWVLGREPRTSGLQPMASILKASVDRMPESKDLPELVVSVRRDPKDRAQAFIELRNTGSDWLRDIALSESTMMALLAPSIANLDGFPGQITPALSEDIRRIGEPISIAAIGPGETATVRRRLIATEGPMDIMLSVRVTVDRGGPASAGRAYYRVRGRNVPPAMLKSD